MFSSGDVVRTKSGTHYIVTFICEDEGRVGLMGAVPSDAQGNRGKGAHRNIKMANCELVLPAPSSAPTVKETPEDPRTLAREAAQAQTNGRSTITILENAHRQVRLALEAGQDDVAYTWKELADSLHARLQREADRAAQTMARVTGSSSGTYEITYTDGTVAVRGAWSK